MGLGVRGLVVCGIILATRHSRGGAGDSLAVFRPIIDQVSVVSGLDVAVAWCGPSLGYCVLKL
jgi:hypothetical protein